jgi:hypothetical protein
MLQQNNEICYAALSMTGQGGYLMSSQILDSFFPPFAVVLMLETAASRTMSEFTNLGRTDPFDPEQAGLGRRTRSGFVVVRARGSCK